MFSFIYLIYLSIFLSFLLSSFLSFHLIYLIHLFYLIYILSILSTLSIFYILSIFSVLSILPILSIFSILSSLSFLSILSILSLHLSNYLATLSILSILSILSVHLSTYLIYLSIYLSIFLSIYLSVYLSINHFLKIKHIILDLFNRFFDFEHASHQSPGWLNDNRESIVKKLGTNSVSLVAKEAGQQWKKLSAAKKKPYEAAAGIHFQNPFMLCPFSLRGRMDYEQWLRENPVGSTFLRGLGQGQGEIRQGPGGFQGRGRRHPETREEDESDALDARVLVRDEPCDDGGGCYTGP